jgi:formate hydrogenlyase subunit 4
MQTNYIELSAFIACVVFGPSLSIGLIRRTKAMLQNRIGAPVYQPLLDLIKFLRKGETISTTTSWVFRNATAVNAAVMIVIAGCVPWLTFKPPMPGCDIFVIIYLFALMRFMTVLAALDAGSAFGGFASSREVTLALLVEPAVMLCLVSLAAVSRSSDLTQIFSFSNTVMANQPGLWIFCGAGLFLASLIDLSRMPADDPTTHLELTMVHEAMILENSGRNLALVEYAHGLKLIVLMGISAQCFLHAVPSMWDADSLTLAAASFIFLLCALVAIGTIEGIAAKLRWTRVPELIAYAVAFSFICIFIAAGGSQ